MDKHKLQRLLADLHRALDDPDVDDETRQLARELDTGVTQLLDRDSDVNDPDPFTDLARNMEAQFAADHPLAQRIIREIANTLANIGI